MRIWRRFDFVYKNALNLYESYIHTDLGHLSPHSEQLLRVICRSGLPNHIHLDLTRILQLVLDALGNLACHQDHVIVTYLIRHYHNSDFPACLNSKGLVHSLEGVGNIF